MSIIHSTSNDVATQIRDTLDLEIVNRDQWSDIKLKLCELFAAARKALRIAQPTLDPKRLIFIDETAATTKMTRLYGRAPQGERLVDKDPHGHWKTTTFIWGCGTTASPLRLCWMAPWTASTFWPRSNKCSFRL